MTISLVATSSRRALRAVGEVEGEHSSEAGIADGLDVLVLLQPLGEDPRRLGLPVDADLECLQPAKQQPGRIRRGHDPGARPELLEAGRMLGAL